VRRGNYLKAAAEQYEAIKQTLGGCSIALEGMLSHASESKTPGAPWASPQPLE
jgi:hypothetical protein